MLTTSMTCDYSAEKSKALCSTSAYFESFNAVLNEHFLWQRCFQHNRRRTILATTATTTTPGMMMMIMMMTKMMMTIATITMLVMKIIDYYKC